MITIKKFVFILLLLIICVFSLLDIKVFYHYEINKRYNSLEGHPLTSNGTKDTIIWVNRSDGINKKMPPPILYEPKPNISVSFVGTYGKVKIKPTYVHINSEGFRDDKDYPIQKPNNTIRIVALGDSFTFGYGVNLTDTWPKQLERLLNENNQNKNLHYEVLNFGVTGYDSEQEVYFFKEKALKYNPDIIIIQFLYNDLENNTLLLINKEKAIENYLIEHNLSSSALSSYEWRDLNLKIHNILIWELDKNITSNISKYIGNVLVPYKELDSLVKRDSPNARILLVMFNDQSFRSPAYPYLQKFALKHGWCFEDDSNIIRNPNYIISPLEPHPNPLGYHKYALNIYSAMKKCGYIH